MIDTTTATAVGTPVIPTTGPLTDQQYLVLWVIALFTTALTWYGSASIICISRRKIQQKHNIYHRLLFIISCIELIISLYIVWGPLLLDADTGYDYPFAIGNQATCTSVGVLALISVISKSFYSCYIACYFMLSVRYNISDQTMIKYEIYAYIVALAVPIILAIMGIIGEAFNPNEFRFCAFARYPITCTGSDCIRGQSAALLSTISTFVSLLLSFIGIICTVLLFLFVRNQTKKTLRHDFTNSIASTSVLTDNQQRASRKESIIHQQQQQRSKLVRTQSILYVSANLNNFIWLFIFNRLILNSVNSDDVHANDTTTFISGIFLFLFMPAYGFFNFCIYCYPRFKRLKSHCPNKSFWWCLRTLYSKDEGESEIIAFRREKLLKRSQCSTSGSLHDLFSSSLTVGGLSVSDPVVSQQQAQPTTPVNINSLIPKIGETASFHGSLNTLSTEDEVSQAKMNIVDSSDVDVEVTTILHEEIQMMDDIETAEDSNNKLYVDF